MLLFVSVVSAEPQQRQAASLFQEGHLLYQQRLNESALIKFREAARLGHVEAAYYAGNIIRRKHTFITTEAERYYVKAAEGGDVYAMLRLAQQDSLCGTLRDCDYDSESWLQLAIATARPIAESGDAGAMMALSSAYAIKGDQSADFEWVERAAESGHAFAQYWMAVMLDEQNRGFYWTESGRREDVLRWLEASAKQGFPKAILKLATEYAIDGRTDKAAKWIDRMGQTDYFDALYEYGLLLIDGPGDGAGFLQYPEAKPTEGLAMLFALYRETGDASVGRSIERRLPDLESEVVIQARAKAKELLVDTPVLHYLPKFGM